MMHKALVLTKHPDEYRRLIEAWSLPDLSLVTASEVADGLAHGGDSEILMGDPARVVASLPHLPRLRWVQLTWAGVERMLDPTRRRDYVLTNIRGVFEPLMSEYVFGYLLAHEVVTFVGASMAVRRNSHIHVEFVYRYLQAGVGRALSTVVDVVRVLFLGYATWLAITLVPRMQNLKMTIVDFPMSYVYGLVAAGFALMTFRAVQVALRHRKQGWRVLERPGEAEV